MPDYTHVSIEEIPDAPSPTRHKKEVDEVVGATEFGFNLYTAEPGEQLPWGRHYHPDHEELFYVTNGQISVETPDGEFLVGAGEAFFVPRGAPQKAVAVGEESIEVVAVGAPKADDRAVIREECPSCGKTTGREYESIDSEGRRTIVLTCAACGTEVLRFGAGPDPE